jgi:hypothetical protein
MTYMQAIYAILISGAAYGAVGCERDASTPAAGPRPAQTDSGGDDKTRIQLNLGKQGSVDIEKSDKGSN